MSSYKMYSQATGEVNLLNSSIQIDTDRIVKDKTE